MINNYQVEDKYLVNLFISHSRHYLCLKFMGIIGYLFEFEIIFFHIRIFIKE